MVLLLAGMGVVSAANLVSNPSFELPLIAGDFVTCPGGTCPAGQIPQWTIGGNLNIIRLYWTSIDGSQSIDMSGEGARGTLSQMIPTTTNGPYKLKFLMSGNFMCDPTTKQIAVYWDNNPSAIGTETFTRSATWSVSNMEWVEKSMTLPDPVGSPTELRLVDISAGVTNCGVALDNVIVEPLEDSTPVPEFPTIALPAALIVGLIGAVLFIRKSKEN